MTAVFLEVIIQHLPAQGTEPDRVITILVEVTKESIEQHASKQSIALPALSQDEKEKLVGEMADSYALDAASETWPLPPGHSTQVSHYFVDDAAAAINDRPPAYTDDYGVRLWLQSVTS